jgi:hypothetical protein
MWIRTKNNEVLEITNNESRDDILKSSEKIENVCDDFLHFDNLNISQRLPMIMHFNHEINYDKIRRLVKEGKNFGSSVYGGIYIPETEISGKYKLVCKFDEDFDAFVAIDPILF